MNEVLFRKLEKKIALIADILRRNRNIGFAYLFGSRTTGRSGSGSDWDIAVYFKKYAKATSSWGVFRLEAEVSNRIGEEAHIVPLNGLDSPVSQFQVISRGLVVVDHDHDARIEYEVRTLRKYHDWRYFLERHMTSG